MVGPSHLEKKRDKEVLRGYKRLIALQVKVIEILSVSEKVYQVVCHF